MTPEQAAERIRELRQPYDRTLLSLVGLERYCDFATEHELPLPDDWMDRIVEVLCDLGGVVAALANMAMEHHRQTRSENRNEDHIQRTG